MYPEMVRQWACHPVHTNAPDIIGETFTINNEHDYVEEITRAPDGRFNPRRRWGGWAAARVPAGSSHYAKAGGPGVRNEGRGG